MTKHPPSMPIDNLDTLWFQVSGTLCNLTCEHCFISCSPKNKTFGFLSLETVEGYLQQAKQLGVKEFYFTGGEPFLNKEIVPILLRTLDFGPATILTNGTVLKDDWLIRLANKQNSVAYGLEFRVSIDGYDSATNDPIRGQGTFDRAIRGVKQLIDHGFLPIITATRTWPERDDPKALERFAVTLRSIGCTQPRIKLLPTLKLGAEAERNGGYVAQERVEPWMLDEVGRQHFVCSNSRIVSDRGIHVCPILLDTPQSVMVDLKGTLNDSLRPFPLEHGACYTCYQFGAICSNAPSSPKESQSNVKGGVK